MSKTDTADEAGISAVSRPAPRRRSRRADSPFWAALFVGPNVILFTVFMVIPIVWGLALSLFDWNLIYEPRFVGFDNYVALLNDARAINSVSKTVYLLVLGVVPTVFLSFVLAVLINTNFPGYSVFRTMYLLPIVISLVASAVLWKFMYDPRVGPIAQLLSFFGISGPNWLQDTTWAMPALSLVIVWLRLPLGIILYLAALQQINPQLLEAAEIDGAGPWAKLRHIIWPNVMPVTLLILVLTLRGIIFDSFDIAFVMTKGGPLNSTDILAVYIYDLAFAQLRLGYASALSTVLFVIVTILALIFNPPRRRPTNGDPV
ncbi:carbohydrate ABC transporter permease [Devosia sp. A16]|uniref:carbohydrate ABC transporter permease n=1 Tax=Devosia sp. A16 TaxID=1736675 RepID=UPI0006D7FE60|nr:sugar ABC transporter permease [Devosia sp. A16]